MDNMALNTTYSFIYVNKIYDILYWVVVMKIFCIFLLFFFINGCQTIENKSKKEVKKENEKLSKFLQQPESELKISMGKPDDIIYDDNGSKFFIYTKKKQLYSYQHRWAI